MVHYCLICDELSNVKKLHRSFHRLPKDTDKKDEWLNIIHQQGIILKRVPSKYSLVCSRHFEESSFLGNRLKKDAVPTIFDLPNISSIRKQIQNKMKTKETKVSTDIFPVASISRTAIESIEPAIDLDVVERISAENISWDIEVFAAVEQSSPREIDKSK